MSDGAPTLRLVTDDEAPAREAAAATTHRASPALYRMLAWFFVVLGAIEIALALLTPGAAWNRAEHSLLLRIAAIGFDLLCLAGFVIVLGLPAAVMLKLADRWKGLRGFVRGLLFPGVCLLMLLAAANWLAMWKQHAFLTAESLAAWLSQPPEAIFAADWRLLVGLPLGAITMTGMLLTAGPAIARRRCRGLTVAALLMLLTAAALAGVGELLTHDDPKGYGKLRSEQAGVFAHAAASLWRRGSP